MLQFYAYSLYDHLFITCLPHFILSSNLVVIFWEDG